jgi:hypothetical protein
MQLFDDALAGLDTAATEFMALASAPANLPYTLTILVVIAFAFVRLRSKPKLSARR